VTCKLFNEIPIKKDRDSCQPAGWNSTWFTQFALLLNEQSH
jgi:hypothetical protein